MHHSRIAARLYNAPLLLMPEKADVIERVFRAHQDDRAGELASFELPARLAPPASLLPMRQTAAGYAIAPNGVAVVEVLGSLVQRGTGMSAASGLTGYNALAAELDAAMRDPMVRGVVLDMDSPGGEVAGAFELASFIASATKPIYAVANELAASAAYLLASAADRVFVPQTGLVGSVGVVMLHVDRSRANDRAGVTYTPIFAGAKKVDGSSLGPLTESARAEAQTRVDMVYRLFVDAVAQRRGMTPDAVRATEAGILTADAAKAAGLADVVGTLGDAVQAMADELNAGRSPGKPRATRATSTTKGATMDNEHDTPAPATSAAAPEPTTVANPAPVAPAASRDPAIDDAQAAGYLAGQDAGRTAERERIRAILTDAAAADRPKLASHLALATDLELAAALPVLAAAAPEVAAGRGNVLAARMPANPRIGADAEPETETRVRRLSSVSIFDSRRKATEGGGAAK
jgi:signal peptide peptidase SppA